MSEIYKYDIKNEEINELNKIINKLEEEYDKKTLGEIIKNNDELTKNDRLKLKNIQNRDTQKKMKMKMKITKMIMKI